MEEEIGLKPEFFKKMMKKIYFFLLLVMVISEVKSQDTLYFTNGQKQVLRITTIDPNFINATFYNNAQSPSFTFLKSEIYKIHFSNGSVHIFTPPPVIPKATKPKPVELKPRFFASLNFLYLFTGRLNLNFEKLILEDYVCLIVPLTYVIDETFDNYFYSGDYQLKFKAGVGFHLYSNPHSRASFVFGPIYEMGQVVYTKTTYLYNNNYYSGSNQTVISKTTENLTMNALSLQMGARIRIGSKINFKLLGGLGLKYYNNSSNNPDFGESFFFNPGFNVGYAF